MITEDYCSEEIGLLLKEKGFRPPCVGKTMYKFIDEGKVYAHVTHQMACKWLREEHKIHIEVLCPVVDVDSDEYGVKYNVVISNLNNHCLAFDTPLEDVEYDSYEEGVEAAIKYCLVYLV